MAVKKIKIDLNYVKPGTTFIFPLFSEEGEKILEKRVILTKKMIEDMKATYGASIYYAKEVRERTIPDQSLLKASEKAKELLDEISHSNKLSKESYNKAESVVDHFLSDLNLSELTAINLLKSLKTYDDYLYQHMVNVGLLTAIYLKKQGNFSSENVKHITLGAYMIDIGMMKVDKQLLKKEGKFEASEMMIMRRHPQMGYEILKNIKGINPLVLQTVLFHHEKFNNRGYYHLPYDNLPIPPKIVSICDSYDAFTSNRPYRKAFSPAFSLKVLVNSIDTIFSYKMVHDFINTIGPLLNNSEPFFSVGEFCELNTGEVALIKEHGSSDLLKPKLFIFCRFEKKDNKAEAKFFKSPIEVDLVNDNNRHISKIFINEKQINLIRINLLERKMLLEYLLENKTDKN